MTKSMIAALVALGLIGTVVIAQPYGNRPGSLEDFLGRLDRDNPNSNLDCTVRKRINRYGDIIWLRMECRGERR